MHIQFVLQTVPEAREESDHEVCPPPRVVSSNVQNTTTEVKALFYLFVHHRNKPSHIFLCCIV